MTSFYDKDLDYLEVMQINSNSYGIEISEFMTIYLDENTGEVVGFSIEGVTNENR